MKDYIKEFEKRLNNHNFKAISPTIIGMNKNQIINQICNLEVKDRFKSTEYQLIHRLDDWISLNTLETKKKGENKKNPKIHIKKQRRPLSMFGQIGGYGLGMFSKSMENLANLMDEIVETKTIYKDKLIRNLKSENDTECADSTLVKTIEFNDKTNDHDEVFLENSDNSSAKLRRKNNFIPFRTKGGSLKSINKQKSQSTYTECESQTLNRRAKREYNSEKKDLNHNLSQNANTISIQKQEWSFSRMPKDSVRHRGHRTKFSGPVFYIPAKETCIGQI